MGKDIKQDLRSIKINNWTKSVQDRVKWNEAFEKVETFSQ
jgi:hypothetical protein